MIRGLLLVLASCLVASVPIASAQAPTPTPTFSSSSSSSLNTNLNSILDDVIVLSSYHVSTSVSSRLALTSIDMVFENQEDCSSVYGMTIQLPRNARVTELIMDLSDGCQLESQVKNLDDAVDYFQNFSSEGKAAAIITAWDMGNYKLQVSIPPNGTTNVSLRYQELLVQKLHYVDFQVPMFPGKAVNDLKVDISVEDPNMVKEFQAKLQDETILTSLVDGKASMHYEMRGVPEDSTLPSLFRANFRPNHAETSLFLSDGECFTQLFNPEMLLSSAGSMAKKIVFVIDVSGSMMGQKLADAKAAFALMIDTLDERDTLIVHSFSTNGTKAQFGPEAATPGNKTAAEEFVMNLEEGGSTNLNDAFIHGIERVEDAIEPVVPILVILTDGKGNLASSYTARNVRDKNEGGKVKIFSLAFGADADIDLLLGIAIQNGGRAVRIYEGYGDSVAQMEVFYKQELGTILMSDVNVTYDFGEIDILDSTASNFPVFAAGSEIVVRGRMNSSISRGVVSSVMSANTAIGQMEWPADHLVIPADSASSDCRQSFAQARIVELLEYRDAERSLGDELLIGTAMHRSTKPSFEEQAQEIALDAGLVWPGLTALVTVENASCQQNSSDICYSGVGNRNPNPEAGKVVSYDPGYRDDTYPPTEDCILYRMSSSKKRDDWSFWSVSSLLALILAVRCCW